MKSKIKKSIIGVALAAIIGIAGSMYIQSQSENKLSGLLLDNIEAMTYELPEFEIECGRVSGPCNEKVEYIKTIYSDVYGTDLTLLVYCYYCNFTGSLSDYCGDSNYNGSCEC